MSHLSCKIYAWLGGGILILSFLSSMLHAQDYSVTIRGDSESPTVLYLVPWKKKPSPQANNGFGMEVEEDFRPLTRSEVIRDMKYYKQVIYSKKLNNNNKPRFLP